jgi:hypothetical protein
MILAVRRRTAVAALATLALLTPSAAGAAGPDLSGRWRASSKAGRCAITLSKAAVPGTPHRNARRVDFPKGRDACTGLGVGDADIWVVENGRLRLGHMVGPGQYDFTPFHRVSGARYRNSTVTLDKAD